MSPQKVYGSKRHVMLSVLLIRIRKATGSNLGTKTSYTDGFFVVFLSFMW